MIKNKSSEKLIKTTFSFLCLKIIQKSNKLCNKNKESKNMYQLLDHEMHIFCSTQLPINSLEGFKIVRWNNYGYLIESPLKK